MKISLQITVAMLIGLLLTLWSSSEWSPASCVNDGVKWLEAHFGGGDATQPDGTDASHSVRQHRQVRAEGEDVHFRREDRAPQP